MAEMNDDRSGLRVAVLTWDTPPHVSGLGRAAIEIAQALSGAGCDVVLVDASRPAGSRTEIDGIARIGCGAGASSGLARLRGWAGIGHLAAPLMFRRALACEHAREPFDVVEGTNWYAPTAMLHGLGIPVVVRNSTPAIDARPTVDGFRGRLDLSAAHRIERWAARRADALISNTQGHADNIEQLYALPASADHGVVALALDPETIRRGRAAPLASENEQPRALFVGRMERRKGFDEALAAHLLVAARRNERGLAPPMLDIVGVAPDELGSRLAGAPFGETVVAHGKIDDDGLFGLMERATLVLAPSRYESYGIVYREAAAFGRPLVACDEDQAARAFVGSTGCGLLATACEPDAIASELERMLADRDLQTRCREAGFVAAAGLSRETLAAETLAVYRRAMNR